MTNPLPTAIIGGGPVALAAAAQLVRRKLPFMLFEGGTQIGASVLSWRHVRMFSPWTFNIDSAAKELLLESGWIAPPQDEMPTGEELVKLYLEPLSELAPLKPNIHLESTVKAIYRKGFDKMKTAGRERAPFIVEYERQGRLLRAEASAVIDATGTWLTPNPIGASGSTAEGEKEFARQIAYGIPDSIGSNRDRYAGKNIVVVGSGHSAIQSLTLLHELKLQVPATTIHWALRKNAVTDAFGGGENDGLPARGELGTRANQYVQSGNVLVHAPFLIHRLTKDLATNKITLHGTKSDRDYAIDKIDEVIVAAGSRPDFSFLRELRYAADSVVESVPQLAELIDPNLHSCGTVRPHGEAELRQPEKNFYLVGSKSYGRAPTFLLATGYEQVRSVVAALAGDYEAAREVKLQLPETGVCSVPKPSASVTESAGCCGPQLKKQSFKPLAVSNSSSCRSPVNEEAQSPSCGSSTC
ncbi:NAD(P)-binding domain-containing protein [Paenibacillus methanolicus]|uniref:Thioredoxin reductase n=1 Tax=Paenibacillus methanolicus TaxID=582686 RepID=A0A5S5C1P1_9BACL|nr:NAD(P)-binding domain-containing protein [Paenibacillus methanolicus]TYP72382.1 thioredoxin reductase [Paenibacillus methanolicus]